jgi:hypothetical protein
LKKNSGKGVFGWILLLALVILIQPGSCQAVEDIVISEDMFVAGLQSTFPITETIMQGSYKLGVSNQSGYFEGYVESLNTELEKYYRLRVSFSQVTGRPPMIAVFNFGVGYIQNVQVVAQKEYDYLIRGDGSPVYLSIITNGLTAYSSEFYVTYQLCQIEEISKKYTGLLYILLGMFCAVAFILGVAVTNS